jgi:hypothetical protein
MNGVDLPDFVLRRKIHAGFGGARWIFLGMTRRERGVLRTISRAWRERWGTRTATRPSDITARGFCCRASARAWSRWRYGFRPARCAPDTSRCCISSASRRGRPRQYRGQPGKRDNCQVADLGLGHYEGRGWRGFHHHAALCVEAYGFLLKERIAIPPSGPCNRPLLQEAALSEGFRPRGAADPTRAAHHDIHRHAAPDHRRGAGKKTAPLSMLSPSDPRQNPNHTKSMTQ